ncbi:TrkH family potassium uptake protein [Stenotrophobium rhamnosiphilum]|uniref:Trk system potassium uptake protein n=1 Tax=Stenotrophobium rhamnosiphilum TaxID=2029166 RepID=A0A2T5MF65_9GAMM|nr:TrkH family potassium uptake protein [Stenotrophobium rhamnosiphilum]PTU31225.1 potassium transporter [Stenotrophobium rhamnosiphilum]
MVYTDKRTYASPARRFAAVQRITGVLLMMFSLSMLPPMLISLLYSEGVVYAFMEGFWITLLTGAIIYWPVRHTRAELKTRDGFLVVVAFWAVLSVFGSIPFYFTHVGWHTFIDALFESVSGLTTTGATVIPSGIDNLPHAINYYRAQLSWLGGMGIIVLAVAILPMLGVGGMQLYKAETPGPMKDSKLTPRIAETARALWIVYLSLTVLCGFSFWLAGMPPFDAIVHSMSTMATGGFSNHDASIGYYNSPLIEYVVIFFMMLGALNFATHFAVWRSRSLGAYLRDTEAATSVFIVLGFTVLIMIPLFIAHTYDGFEVTLRKALFHVVSYGSTTGFGTSDPSIWPSYAPVMLILTFYMVGCAGSTAGGVKVVRLMLFVKQAAREMQRLIHPSAELPIKLGGKVVPDPIVYAIGGFFSVYIGATLILITAMIATGLDPLAAFATVSACINNSGPGLGAHNTSMASVSEAGKCILIFTMLLGRLEIFSLLIIFTPAFWRR